MLGPSAIHLRPFVRVQCELRVSLIIRQALPQRERKIGALVRRQFHQFGEVYRCHLKLSDRAIAFVQ